MDIEQLRRNNELLATQLRDANNQISNWVKLRQRERAYLPQADLNRTIELLNKEIELLEESRDEWKREYHKLCNYLDLMGYQKKDAKIG